MKHYYFDKNQYNFSALLKQLFGVSELELLHENLQSLYSADDGIAGLGNDTHSIFHEIFYKKLNNNWKDFEYVYHSFIRNKIFPLFLEEESLIYQTLPSFRIQYPKAKAVTTIHCDSDEHHKHPLGEINILIPLTEMFDTSTIWIESVPNLGDYKPVNMVPSQFMVWNGNRCRHFNKTNLTEKTRVSLDFRILPNKCYNPLYDKQTATTNQKFIIGEYYSRMLEI
tara:strand:+ start:4884 stop:5558 length:675 start_codon:yes stop_codon:yes gene_type:complete